MPASVHAAPVNVHEDPDRMRVPHILHPLAVFDEQHEQAVPQAEHGALGELLEVALDLGGSRKSKRKRCG